jgi:arylsulfatase A-like enzyme
MLVFGLAALALSAATVACAPPETPPSMVIIVIDTLRADHLGLYGYVSNPTSPNLDERAATAAVFERAHSTAPWTLPSFGSMFTGQLPTRHSAGVRVGDYEAAVEAGEDDDIVVRPNKTLYRLDDQLPTLAATLQTAGYRTAAIMNNSFLTTEFGLNRGFETYDFDPRTPERTATEATDLALDWLRRYDDSPDPQPFLLVVHYFDPHLPYDAPAPYLGRFAGRYESDQFRLPMPDTDWLRYNIRQRVDGWQELMAMEQALYDEEIAYTDSEVERLLAALDERGFGERGYVLLTSDHGEEFHDHGGSEHGHTVYEELIRVPMLVWGPGVRPGGYQLPVSLLDIMPTLLDIADVPAPAELPGASLWPALREGPASRTASAIRFDRPLIAEGMLYGDEKKALIRWPWKLMVDIQDEGQWLYDLASDPKEENPAALDNLDDAGRDRLLTMMAELQATMEASATTHGERASLSESTLERLRALGYIR